MLCCQVNNGVVEHVDSGAAVVGIADCVVYAIVLSALLQVDLQQAHERTERGRAVCCYTPTRLFVVGVVESI